MNIVVFGANGNIGRRVVALLLQRNDNVTAFVHSSSQLPNNPKLKVISGDIYNVADVERALAGAEVVVSTLGSWGTKNKNVLTVGMQHIIPAMKHASMSRIISLTGSGVLFPDDKPRWYDRLNPLLLKLVAPKILFDGQEHLRLLAASGLDWTVVRSPVMKGGGAKGYQLQSRPPFLWKRVRRNDVAQALVDLTSPSATAYSKKAPFIS